jgi:hypothetical protein
VPDFKGITEEPDTGSVVAINWGRPRQEVWVSNSANVGNWYCIDVPFPSYEHPTWPYVVRRAEAAGSEITLLVAADGETYQAGYRAGVDAAAHKVEAALEEARYDLPHDEADHLAEQAKREANDA